MNPVQRKKMKRDPVKLALRTDIVMDIILSHLNVRDLLSCRKVSKTWNKAASSRLRKRSTMIENISEEEQLMRLEGCMKKNSDFPFVGLRFDEPWLLNSRRAMKFFKTYGGKFTRLCLDTEWSQGLDEMAPFIHHLPRLSILEVGFPASEPPPVSYEVCDCDELRYVYTRLRLPSIRTLRISSDLDEDVLRQVVTAASPSLQIECPNATPQVLGKLQNLGKLRAVSYIEFGEDGENSVFKSGMDTSLSTESPALVKLEFNARGCLSFNGLMKILVSSQQTLKDLALYGQCLYKDSWNELPVFTKLTVLRLRVRVDSDGDLFNGCDGKNFPVLKELKLWITDETKGNPDTVKFFGSLIAPSVTSIDLEGYIDKNGMTALARNFPNVIEFLLNLPYYSGDMKPFEIWNVREFKHLQKLSVWNYIIKLPTKNDISLDSFLTGLPMEICENLRGQKRPDPSHTRFNDVSRANPSILQLENLKELIVCVKLGNGVMQPTEESPFISMVSVWYALEKMPKLRTKFVYALSSPPSLDEERDKAVLEAAFKHVQDYIELEPYFY